MEFSPEIVAPIVASMLIAGAVKGVIGMGFPSIVMALLAIAMPPAQAAMIMVIPSLITNVWQMFAGPFLARLLRRLWSLLVGSALGIWLGGGILTSPNSRYAALGLGLALMAYGLSGLVGLNFSVSRRAERWLSFPIGLTTGLIAGATGVVVLPASAYFQAIGLERDELVQMLGINFTVSMCALLGILWRDGVMQLDNSMISVLSVLPALIGMAAGQWLRGLASPAVFRWCFFGGLLALGLQQTIRNLV